MDLLTFVLCAYGLTQILVYSDMPIIAKLRPSKEILKGYGKVFKTPVKNDEVLESWIMEYFAKELSH